MITDRKVLPEITNASEFAKVLNNFMVALLSMQQAEPKCTDVDTRREMAAALGDAESAFRKLQNINFYLKEIEKCNGKAFK